jgi:uncharacterized protein YdaU (DUF1376 family)
MDKETVKMLAGAVGIYVVLLGAYWLTEYIK